MENLLSKVETGVPGESPEVWTLAHYKMENFRSLLATIGNHTMCQEDHRDKDPRVIQPQSCHTVHYNIKAWNGGL